MSNAKTPSLPFLFFFGGICLLIIFTNCKTENKAIDSHTSFLNSDFKALKDKHKGAHVFGNLDSVNLRQFSKNNIEWITIVAWADQEAHESPSVRHGRLDSASLKKSNADFLQQIKAAHQAGFKVFVKPHIWLFADNTDKWRSDIYPSNDQNWLSWKNSYRDFVLRYARIAEKGNVEMFCIGAELTRITLEKPDFWTGLIKEVREVYSGKITYAANWYKEYDKIDFWDQLDYIGIQAYFPLTKKENPSIREIELGWKKYVSELASLSTRTKKKILFTELGYKSTPDAAIRPWEWIDYEFERNKPLSVETQANCYQAFYNIVWHRDWFAGVHLWQMRSDFEKGRGKSDLDFTPQGKPAEEIITSGFGGK